MNVFITSDQIDIGGVSVTLRRDPSLQMWSIKHWPSEKLSGVIGSADANERSSVIAHAFEENVRSKSTLAQQCKELAPVITQQLKNFPSTDKRYDVLSDSQEWGDFIRDSILPLIQSKITESGQTPVDTGIFEFTLLKNLQDGLAWCTAPDADISNPSRAAYLQEHIMNALMTLTPREHVQEVLVKTAKDTEQALKLPAPEPVIRLTKNQLREFLTAAQSPGAQIEDIMKMAQQKVVG